MFNWIAGLFTPVNKLVETLDLKGNQKQSLINALAEIQASANEKLIDLEKAALTAQTERIVAESKSENFLQANWRPFLSVSLGIAIILAAYGIGKPSDQLYHLTEIVIGINMSSRGLEKVASVGGLGSIVKNITGKLK